MKKTIAILVPMAIGILLSATLWAQIPGKMSYQAVIRNTNDTLITNTNIGMQISILQGATSGTAVYAETQTPLTNANGLISIEIGAGTVINGDFATIDWANGPYFIKTETDLNGGANYTITGTNQLLSVPYALHAKTTSGLNSYSVGDFAHGGIVFWVDQTGQHGLVCVKEDQGTEVKWFAGTYMFTLATGNGPFSGKMNTTIIIANQGEGDSSNYAARMCGELQITEGGKTYGDWYLPSKKELELMYQNKATIDATAGTNGGSALASEIYWSSTDGSTGSAWMQYFDTGVQEIRNKNLANRVRAVRAF